MLCIVPPRLAVLVVPWERDAASSVCASTDACKRSKYPAGVRVVIRCDGDAVDREGAAKDVTVAAR